MSAQPIAILGGTFDPVHNGHLRVAWEVSEALDAQVRLMPANVPPHRAPPVASARQRVALLHAALAGQARLQVDDRELRRKEPSYTVVTLRELRGELGPKQPLILLVGADAFAGLPTWHEWRSLFELAHIGVLTRPGHAVALPAELHDEIAPRRAERAALRRHAAGREPRWLLPDALLADPAMLEPYRRAHRS